MELFFYTQFILLLHYLMLRTDVFVSCCLENITFGWQGKDEAAEWVEKKRNEHISEYKRDELDPVARAGFFISTDTGFYERKQRQRACLISRGEEEEDEEDEMRALPGPSVVLCPAGPIPLQHITGGGWTMWIKEADGNRAKPVVSRESGQGFKWWELLTASYLCSCSNASLQAVIAIEHLVKGQFGKHTDSLSC